MTALVVVVVVVTAYLAWCGGVRWERRNSMRVAYTRLAVAYRADQDAFGRALESAKALDEAPNPGSGAIARRQLDLAKADAQRTARELEQARGAWDLTVARDRLSALVPWRRGVRRG